jgi:hypothetical protein
MFETKFFIYSIFVLTGTFSAGRSEARERLGVVDGTSLGIGFCEFSTRQLCEVRVVGFDENLNAQKLDALKFKTFTICEGTQFSSDLLRVNLRGLDDLKNHLIRLRNLSEDLNEMRRRRKNSLALAFDQRSKRALGTLLKNVELIFSRSNQLNSYPGPQPEASHGLNLDNWENWKRSTVKLFLINQELASALSSNFQYPVDEDQNLFQALGSLASNHSPVIGISPKGRACNLRPQASVRITYPDGRYIDIYDPESSSFWSRPLSLEKIGKSNLSLGYDRRHQVNYSNLVYTYDSPKDGYGINPGFNVRGSDKALYKIRLGHEVHSGPFNSRLVHAMGFPVLKIDYVKGLETQFDIKILREFNSRKSLGFNLTFLGQKLKRFELQGTYDPFDYIDSGILKSGEVVTPEQLKLKLVKPNKLPADFQSLDSFDLTFANQIQSLKWKEVSIEKKEDAWEALGAWFYEGLHHENRRELRGFAVLAAWLGIFDIRWENTRVFKVTEKSARPGAEKESLKHVISDLGSGLGRSGGILTNSIAEVSDISKTFFQLIYGYMDLTGQLQPWAGNQDLYPVPEPKWIPVFTKYSSILPNEAFRRTDFEDTLWMATYILQMRPHQIQQAAEASGFSLDEIKILVERLVSRQANLRRELYLEGAIIEDTPQK